MRMYSPGELPKSKYFVITQDLILPVMIIILVITGAWITFKSQFFALKEVVCKLDYEPCPDGAVAAELNKYLGSNLITLETFGIGKRLTEGDFTIREAVFRKKLPNRLNVELQSVFPVAALRVSGIENEWLVLDSRNRIIGMRKEFPNVPTVLIPEPLAVRVGVELQDPELIQALAFASAIAKEIHTVQTVSLQGDTLLLKLQDGKTVLFSTRKDQTEQIRLLQAILADTTMSNDVRTIDVRFSKPVLESN